MKPEAPSWSPKLVMKRVGGLDHDLKVVIGLRLDKHLCRIPNCIMITTVLLAAHAAHHLGPRLV
jgi:hypothetical protein